MTDDPYPYDFHGNSVGISFHLPTRRRFIPNSWLLHADLNERATEIQVHYTHSLVTIDGTNLANLHEQVAKFGVSWVRELSASPKADNPTVTRIEITEKTAE
jgi:hypothetical protein